MKSLKISLFVFAILTVSIISSCEKIKDKINDATAFDVSQDLPDHNFELNADDFDSSKGIEEDWVVMTEMAVYVNVDSIFDANGLSSASIRDGTITSVVVSMVNPPAGVNFDFVSAMKATVSDDVNFSSELIVASTGQIAAGSTSVIFNLNNANITDYIDKKNFYLRLYGDRNSSLPGDIIYMSLTSSVKFTVDPL